MNTKIVMITAAILLGIAIGVGAISIASKSQQEASADSAKANDGLKGHARKARAEGRQEISVGGLIVEYGDSAAAVTPDELLSRYAVVKAEPVERQSYAFDSQVIVTWYKFRIKETLSEPAMLACPNCPEPDLPQDLLPIQSDEFLFCKSGGSLVIDGVKVTMLEEGFPPFKINHDYLLFVSRRSSGTAEIAGGPIGSFIVKTDGKLESISARKYPSQERIKNQLGDSIGEMKRNLNARRPSR